MRDRLKELLRGKSIDQEVDVEYVADFLLSEGVIVPPCKVGDKLYEVIDDEELFITELTVTEVGTKVVFYSGYVPPKDDIHYHIPIDEIGKAYFFTQEEAEKALAERSENEHKTGNK